MTFRQAASQTVDIRYAAVEGAQARREVELRLEGDDIGVRTRIDQLQGKHIPLL